jgi:hypothetical protein
MAVVVELRLDLDHACAPGGISPAMRGVLPVGPAIGQLVGRVEGAQLRLKSGGAGIGAVRSGHDADYSTPARRLADRPQEPAPA